MTVSAQKGQWRSVVFGGVLPIVAFTVAEELYGIVWGLILGMIIGVIEIAYEWVRFKKVEPITLGANGLILVLGSVSLLFKEGIWFKLQPAIIEAVMAVVLFASVYFKKPFLVMMGDKQNLWDRIPDRKVPVMKQAFTGLTLRIGVFFLLHAALATWAALYWSNRHWALLKGIGFTGSMILYLLIEGILLRRRVSTLP